MKKGDNKDHVNYQNLSHYYGIQIILKSTYRQIYPQDEKQSLNKLILGVATLNRLSVATCNRLLFT